MKILLLLFLTAFPLHPAQAQAPAASAPDFANGQPAEQVTVSIPHSSRTKDNFSDIALDFLLTKLFEQQKDVKISYDFMESDFSDRTLAFRNFSVAPDKPDVKGKVSLGLFRIELNDLVKLLRSGVMTVSKIEARDIKGSLDFYVSGQKTNTITASADHVVVDKITERLNTSKVKLSANESNVIVLHETVAKNAVISLPMNKTKYKTAQITVKNIAVHREEGNRVTFESATVNGKTVKTADELKKLIQK